MRRQQQGIFFTMNAHYMQFLERCENYSTLYKINQITWGIIKNLISPFQHRICYIKDTNIYFGVGAGAINCTAVARKSFHRVLWMSHEIFILCYLFDNRGRYRLEHAFPALGPISNNLCQKECSGFRFRKLPFKKKVVDQKRTDVDLNWPIFPANFDPLIRGFGLILDS